MSNRLSAFCLALLLAAPLCVLLDDELMKPEESADQDGALVMLSRETMERHAEGLRHDAKVFAQN